MQFGRFAGRVRPPRSHVGFLRPALIAAAFALAVFAAGAIAGAAGLPAGANSTSKAAAKPAVKPGSKGKAGASARPRGGFAAPVVLYHVNHRETLRLRLADDRGKPVAGVQRQINRFLRCHYTKRQHSINPRLTRLLYEVGRNYPGRRIEVVSGYRHPKFAKNPRSPHMKGLACDMRVVGVKNTELRDFFRQRFKNVGVGYYPNSSFVHLDVRKSASAFWIDYSGPGENAIYARDASEDLRSGRADRWKRTTIDPSWADEDTASDAGGMIEAAPEEGAEADVNED